MALKVEKWRKISFLMAPHFIFNLNYEKTLAMKRDSNIEYGIFVSGHNCMNEMVMLGGDSEPYVELPLTIFQNKNWYYCTRGVPGSVPRVSYPSGPKAWIDMRVFS